MTRGGGFKTVTWACAGCGEEVSQRFHVATDGDPEKTNPLPPAPWSADSRGQGTVYLCGPCSARRATADAEELTDRTFGDCETDAEALERWHELHLCFRCAASPVCRVFDATVRSDPENAVLATVTRCKNLVYLVDV